MTHISSTKRLFALAVAAVLSLAPAMLLHAQTSALGNIAGTVSDTSGAIVPNADVVVTDTDTGISHTVTTTSTGDYAAKFLEPGHYEVLAGGGSFGKVNRTNLVLTVGETLTVDFSLPIGATSTEVTVSSASPLLDTEKTEVSQTLGENMVANLPVNARNWSDFVLLTPNVVQDGGSGLISFHGISGLYNQNYVDGSNNNEMLFSETRGRSSGAFYVYSVDSIKEFQAESSNYSAEFGQAAGGQVNAITKSGTNAIHGDLFYYLRYPALNALDPYTKYQALHNTSIPATAALLLTQPIHQQQQFGGSVGGPIMKDKLFYFFTYDGFRRVGKVLYTDSNIISLTPSGTTSSTTTITPTQCPATISSTQCTSAITFLMAQSTATPTRFVKSNLFFPKLDWHINSRNDAFVDFNFEDFDSTYGYQPAPTYTNSSPSTQGPASYHERFLVGGLTTQLGKGSVNEIHAQWGKDLETAGANASGPSVAIGSSGSLVDTFGMPNALPRIAEPNEKRIQFTDVFSTTRGRHSLKAGGDINLVHEVMINLFQGGGVYGYGDGTPLLNFQDWVQDAFAGQTGDTDPYAGYHYNTFVQTVDSLNTAALTQGKDDFWMKMFDGFAEDTWKVTPTFTLTAGVRYDIQLTPAPGMTNTNYPPVSNKYSQTIKNVTDRVQPRVGFSWSPFTGTVVRGGYGMFSALNQGSTYYAMRVENGVIQINYNYTGCLSSVGPTPVGQSTPNKCTSPPTSAASLQYPNVPFPVTGPPLSLSPYPAGGTAPAVSPLTKLGPQSFHGLDPNFVPPLAHEADLSIEQTLPGKMTLQIGYLGTRALRLPVFVDSNLVGQTPHGIKTYNVQDSSNNVTSQLTVPVYLPTDRINQTLTSYNTGFSVANTWYNSLAVTVKRPFANGLDVLLNYTWAKATDTSQVAGTFGTFYGGDTPLDPNNIRAENGPSDLDIRNRMTLSFVYKPQLFESNKIVKNVLDGFQFSGTEIASGGEPISLSMSGTVFSGSTSASSYGDEGNIYGGAMSSGSGLATTGRPPQIGRNSVPMVGFNDVDLRVTRDVPIHEKIYLELSAEAFNILNHKIVTGQNGTYSQFLAPNATSSTEKCGATSVPTGSTEQGCIVPFTGTGLSAFGATSNTNGSNLYTSRQAQFIAKFIF